MESTVNDSKMDQRVETTIEGTVADNHELTSHENKSGESAEIQDAEMESLETKERDSDLGINEDISNQSESSALSSTQSTSEPDRGAEESTSESAPDFSRVTEQSVSAETEQPESNRPSEDGPQGENPSLQNLLCSSSSISPCEEASEAAASKPPGDEAGSDYYFVKWINWKGERTPIITQSENGPCPLLAIMNILFLRWKVKLAPQKEVITSEELMAHLGDCILSIQPQENSEALQLNFQQNVNDAMTVLPKLSTGLDVNVRFTGVQDFEYTPECIVFDLLNIPLYHGWLVDPQSEEAVKAIGKLSYNQLVEKIITCKHSNDPNLVTEGLIAEQYLESTAAQLTYHGLCELMGAVKEEELSVFFRNNHFSTLIKHKGHLYLLVTDQGFLQEERVIWESLHNVEGDSCFCDSNFHLIPRLEKEASFSNPQQLQQRQVDQDYMIALSLQQQQQGPLAMSDLELAQQLQQEEYQQQQQQPLPPQQEHPQPPQQPRAQASGRASGERRSRQKQESDCTLL
ncbi:ubiquitin carboxyl-terminal hydrolase MINDY-1 [Spea bombifrons]|uniref:ubiquitin carboxyl-terminal hydrolase MINDY-1 n=1 Tax=Spea bombifrons TaxID=233779 RepID=UPI00234B634E|nr:ubiquitin carboxyl-terminal hydrolase MINDY-1 [Spea bombifrons]